MSRDVGWRSNPHVWVCLWRGKGSGRSKSCGKIEGTSKLVLKCASSNVPQLRVGYNPATHHYHPALENPRPHPILQTWTERWSAESSMSHAICRKGSPWYTKPSNLSRLTSLTFWDVWLGTKKKLTPNTSHLIGGMFRIPFCKVWLGQPKEFTRLGDTKPSQCSGFSITSHSMWKDASKL